MNISACLVIRNEEKLLPRCLESIRNVADEIIVVHDGRCNDKSLEIAKEYGAKVFVREYVGEAEHHRPYSFRMAGKKWILQIDADEFLSEKARKEIPRLIKVKDIDAYSFLWPYPQNNGYIKRGPFAVTLKPCLFRKEKMFMIGISHEYPRTYGILVKRPDILLEHQPLYDNFTLSAFRKKWIKWVKLQAVQVRNIEKASTFNIAKKAAEETFNYYRYMQKHPFLSGLKETFRFIVIYLTRGILWAGIKSWQIAIFELSYLWLVRFYLLVLRHKTHRESAFAHSRCGGVEEHETL